MSQRQVIAARRVAHLERIPERAPGRIFADSLYVLHVNGQEIRRGPGRANPRSRRYDEVDLAPWLRLGGNVITVLAAFNAGPFWDTFPRPRVQAN